MKRARDLGDLLGHQGAREVARHLVERAHALLAQVGHAGLEAQSGGQLADDQRDDEHDGEGQQILRVADAKVKRGGTKKKSNARHAEERGQHRRPAAEAHRGDSTTASRKSMTMLARSSTACSGAVSSVTAAQTSALHDIAHRQRRAAPPPPAARRAGRRATALPRAPAARPGCTSRSGRERADRFGERARHHGASARRVAAEHHARRLCSRA